LTGIVAKKLFWMKKLKNQINSPNEGTNHYHITKINCNYIY